MRLRGRPPAGELALSYINSPAGGYLGKKLEPKGSVHIPAQASTIRFPDPSGTLSMTK